MTAEAKVAPPAGQKESTTVRLVAYRMRRQLPGRLCRAMFSAVHRDALEG
jgi:hypothetical protein